MYVIAEESLLISVLKAYRFGNLKRCAEELKVAVNCMDVDDVNVDVECYKVSGNNTQ